MFKNGKNMRSCNPKLKERGGGRRRSIFKLRKYENKEKLLVFKIKIRK